MSSRNDLSTVTLGRIEGAGIDFRKGSKHSPDTPQLAQLKFTAIDCCLGGGRSKSGGLCKQYRPDTLL